MVRVVKMRVLQAPPPLARGVRIVPMVGRTIMALLPPGDLRLAAAAAPVVTYRLELELPRTRLPH